MKTIAIFSGYYLPHLGGVERYTYNLAKKLKNLGYKIIIITSRYDETLKEIEKTEYAKIYRLPTYKIFKERYPINRRNKKFKMMFKQIRNEKIDYAIVQTRFWTTSYYASKFIAKNKIPSCLIEHGSTHFTVNNRILDKFGEIYEHILTNFLKKNIKDFYGVSKKCTEWLRHFNIEARGVFYNSIDISRSEKYKNYLNKVKDKIIITYIGRMIEEKGVLKLITAFKQLEKKYSNIELYLAGSGPILEKIIEENKNEKNIKILGKISHEEVWKLLGKTNIFINPSAFPEGLPTSILEAGMMKCAVIATPMGGTTEIISNDEIGYICGFETDDILEKLERLIQNEDEILKLGNNIYEIIQKDFSWDNTAKKISKVIENY